jgi:hypothetical protein
MNNLKNSYFDTMLKRYASETPCIQAVFVVNDDILLEYGKEIQSRSLFLQMVEDLKKFDLLATLLAGKIRFSKVKTIEKENQKYDIYTYSIEKNKSIFRTIFLIPTDKTPLENEFKPLNDLVQNYYLNIPQRKEYQVINVYSDFLEKAIKEIDLHFTSKEEILKLNLQKLQLEIDSLKSSFPEKAETITSILSNISSVVPFLFR